MIPQVGKLVWYTPDLDDQDVRWNAQDTVAAMILSCDHPDGSVNLRVFPDSPDTYYRAQVMYSAESKPHTWRDIPPVTIMVENSSTNTLQPVD